MGDSPESQRWAAEKKRLQDQLFTNPDIETESFPVTPYTSFYRTNNFIQQGLNRLMGFNPDTRLWYPVFVDTSGRLLTSPTATEGSHVFIKDREAITSKVLDGEAVLAGGAISHAALNVEEFTKMGVYIYSSDSITWYIQFSDDNINWHDWHDLNDSPITFTTSNARKVFGFGDHAKYIRLVAYNAGAASVTVSATITGVV